MISHIKIGSFFQGPKWELRIVWRWVLHNSSIVLNGTTKIIDWISSQVLHGILINLKPRSIVCLRATTRKYHRDKHNTKHIKLIELWPAFRQQPNTQRSCYFYYQIFQLASQIASTMKNTEVLNLFVKYSAAATCGDEIL